MPPSVRRPGEDQRIVELVGMLRRAKVTCDVVLPWSQVVRVGKEGAAPQFQLRLRNARLLRAPITELALGRAYVQGDVDVEVLGQPDEREDNAMAIFKLRDEARPGISPSLALRLGREIALTRPTRANAGAIRGHYSAGDDFYLTFLDDEYHLYSQCTFPSETASLEQAARRKLNDVWNSLGLRRGDRVLDIGGGWGGFMEFCAKRGVHVTSLTISEDSAKYLRGVAERLAQDHGVRPEVVEEDLLDHRRRQYYDHVAILGVIEHIPTYQQFCERVWDALKKGGRLYLDASATKEKYAASPFIRRYIWGGPHSCLALPDMTEELIFHGFDVLRVRNGSADYERTMREWARRLERSERDVVARWGEHRYRTFRVFLRGGVYAFHTNRLQAYTVVARRRKDVGPRPGRLRRTGHFLLRQRA